jgi:hypothetical protein
MTGSVQDRKEVQECRVVTEDEVGDSNAQMEVSLKISLCFLALQSELSKAWAHTATSLLKLWSL